VQPNLVGAIDGETVAFATVEGDGARLDGLREYKTEQFPTFTDALQGYTRENRLSTAGLPLGLAVAGVTGGDTISLPNCRWYISVSGLKSFLAHEPLVINDFESIAWSLAQIAPTRLKAVGPVPPRPVTPGKTYLVVGTGPGLGMAVLAIGADGGARVFAGEGGHSSFSPQNADEDALLAALRAKLGHVSFERLLANIGLQNIYAFIGERQGRGSGDAPPAEAIVAAATRADAQARAAVDMFTSILGSFVGNIVLSSGTFDGVFLVSPLLGQLLPFLGDGRFRAAFAAKGRMRKALEPVPISYADQPQARLEGVAAALRARQAAKAGQAN
jgi:glucokinase